MDPNDKEPSDRSPEGPRQSILEQISPQQWLQLGQQSSAKVGSMIGKQIWRDVIQRAAKGKSARIPNALKLYQTYERGKEVIGDFKTLHRAENATVDQHEHVRATTRNDTQQINNQPETTTKRTVGLVTRRPSDEANVSMSGRPRKNWGQIHNINQSRKRNLEQSGGPSNKRQRIGTNSNASTSTQTNNRSQNEGTQTNALRTTHTSTQTDLNTIDTNTWEGFRAYRAGGQQNVRNLTPFQRRHIRGEWQRNNRRQREKDRKETERRREKIIQRAQQRRQQKKAQKQLNKNDKQSDLSNLQGTSVSKPKPTP